MTIEEELESRGFEFEEDTRYCGAGKYYDFLNISKNGNVLGEVTVLVPNNDDEPLEYIATVDGWFENSSSTKGMYTVSSLDKSEENCLNTILNCIKWLEENEHDLPEDKYEMSMNDEDEMLSHLSDVNGEDADLSDLYECLYRKAKTIR